MACHAIVLALETGRGYSVIKEQYLSKIEASCGIGEELIPIRLGIHASWHVQISRHCRIDGETSKPHPNAKFF
jgi:hypothetical protein